MFQADTRLPASHAPPSGGHSARCTIPLTIAAGAALVAFTLVAAPRVRAQEVSAEAPGVQVTIGPGGGEGLRRGAWIRIEAEDTLETHLPEYLFRGGPPQVSIAPLNLRGAAHPTYRVVVTTDSGRESHQHHIVFEKHRRELLIIWRGRHAGDGGGERVEVRDLNMDGDDELLLSAVVPGADVCGARQAWIYPRVWHDRSRSFVPVSITPESLPDRIPIAPSAADGHDAFAADTEAHFVSSDGSVALARSWGPAPATLEDNDVYTEWREGAVGAGMGEFVQLTASPHFPITAIEADFGTTPPAELILSLDSQEFLITVPGPGTHRWQLPQPLASTCVSLQAAALPDGADTWSIGEVRALTTLDDVDSQSALDHVLLPLLREYAGEVQQNAVLRVLASAEDDDLVPLLASRMANAGAEEQAIYAAALMRSDAGRNAAIESLANNALHPAAVAEIGRGVGDSEHEIELLLRAVEASEIEASRVQIIRVLSRSVSPQNALRLLPYAGIDPGPRSDVSIALARAPVADVPTLMAALHSEDDSRVDAQRDILRALIRIGRSRVERPEAIADDAVAGLRSTMLSDNGTIARMGVATAGLFAVEAVYDDVREIAYSDPSPPLRAEAISAMANYARVRPTWLAESLTNALAGIEDGDPTVRLEAASVLVQLPLDRDAAVTAVARLRAEGWSEVRRPLARAAVRAHKEASDIAIADYLRDGERDTVRSLLIFMQSRGGPLPVREFVDAAELWRDDERMFASFVRVLAHVDDAEAGRWLTREINREDSPERVRTTAIEAAGRQAVPSAREAIETLARSGGPELQRAAIRALSGYPDDRTLELLHGIRDAVDDGLIGTIDRVLFAIEQGRRLEEISNP